MALDRRGQPGGRDGDALAGDREAVVLSHALWQREFGGDPVLKARVRAVPEDGKANVALEALVADWLHVPRSTVTVIQGAKSRIKIVSIDGNAIGLSALVAARLAKLRSAGL